MTLARARARPSPVAGRDHAWNPCGHGTAFPAVQCLLLAARAAGLGAALNVMPLWNMTLARTTLGLPPWVTPVAVIPIGWPKGRYGETERPRIGSVVHVDHWGSRPFRDRRGPE